MHACFVWWHAVLKILLETTHHRDPRPADELLLLLLLLREAVMPMVVDRVRGGRRRLPPTPR